MSELNDKILNDLLSHIPETYQKTVGFPTWVILKAFSLGLEKGFELISNSYLKLNPENLKGEELDSYIYYRSNISRTQAVFAGGVVTVTGNGVINVGDVFATAGGVRFISGERVEVDGSADVLVSCEVAGTAGNVPAESINIMPVTLTGIASCTNKNPITGGYDEETDEHLLERFILNLQKQPTSGNVWHYTQWALQVDGVGAVKVYPLGHGPHTVDVVIMGADGLPASDEIVKNVQQHIDPESSGVGNGLAPIGARCFVSAAESLNINVSVSVNLLFRRDEENTTQSIKKAITKYFAGIAFKQNYVSIARIGEAILNADGVKDYSDLKINNTIGNLDVGERQVPVLGELTINYGRNKEIFASPLQKRWLD